MISLNLKSEGISDDGALIQILENGVVVKQVRAFTQPGQGGDGGLYPYIALEEVPPTPSA